MSCVQISCAKLKVACYSFYAEVKSEWGDQSNFTKEQKDEVVLFTQLLELAQLSELCESEPVSVDGGHAGYVLKQLKRLKSLGGEKTGEGYGV